MLFSNRPDRSQTVRLVPTAFTAFLLAVTQPAAAVVIDFNAFPNGAFAGGTEDGFTLAVTGTTAIYDAQGAYTQSFGAGAANAAVTLTITGPAGFVFDGLNYVVRNFANALGPVTVQGYTGATLLATDSYAMPPTTGISYPYASVNLLGLTLDRLVLSLTAGQNTSPQIDSITLSEPVPPTSTPEPASGALLLAGTALLAIRRRP